MTRAPRRAAFAGLSLVLALSPVACRRDAPASADAAPAPPAHAPSSAPVAAASAASAAAIAADAAPPPAGELVAEDLGDPQFLTSDGATLFWVDDNAQKLVAWSERDGGVPRVITDSVVRGDAFVRPFTVSGGTVHVLTKVDGERHPRVERLSTAGGPRTVLSNAIPDVVGVAFEKGHVLVVLDLDPPKRSMVGEVFEVTGARKLTSVGTTSGAPRAIATHDGDLLVAGAAGVSRHRPGNKAREGLGTNDLCGPALTTAGDAVYVAGSTEPVLVGHGVGRGPREIALPAFAVALQAHGPALYVGTRETAASALADAGAGTGDRDLARELARRLHEADESVKHRRHIRTILRVDLADGKVSPVAAFDPPASSFAVTDRALYVVSAAGNGSLRRLPLADAR